MSIPIFDYSLVGSSFGRHGGVVVITGIYLINDCHDGGCQIKSGVRIQYLMKSVTYFIQVHWHITNIYIICTVEL